MPSSDPAGASDGRSTITDYEKLGRVGEGTYGVVYRGREKATGAIVALKKVRMDKEKDGVPVTAVREMGILMRCRSHPNIVNLLKVVQGKHNHIFLVFEYCEHDVGKLMQTMRKPFEVSEVKTLTIQLLGAVSFLHSMFVFHRDLKMSNLLLNNRGELKLCDLGLARQFAPAGEDGAYTAKVVTLWYRAPELLFGLRRYGSAIDMWAVGCILAEFLKNQPIFPGKTETETVQRIFAELGAPNDGIWPGWSALPLASTFVIPNQPYNHLSITFAAFGVDAIDLLTGLLTYDPQKRWDADRASKHRFLSRRADPPPRSRRDVPTFRSPREDAGANGADARTYAASRHNAASQHDQKKYDPPYRDQDRRAAEANRKRSRDALDAPL